MHVDGDNVLRILCVALYRHVWIEMETHVASEIKIMNTTCHDQT